MSLVKKLPHTALTILLSVASANLTAIATTITTTTDATKSAQSNGKASNQPKIAKTNKVETKEYGFIAAGGWIALNNAFGNSALAGPAIAGKLNSSFIIEVRQLPKEITPSLGRLRDVQMAEFPNIIKQFKLINEKTTKIAPRNTLALRWIYTGKQNGTFFQWTQLNVIYKKKLYTVTLSLPEGTKREVAAAGQKMLNSFYLK